MPLTTQQKAERLNGIGSSDIAAIAGFSPYGTPHGVWLQKCAGVEIVQNERMMIGAELEPSIARMWARKNKIKLVKGQTTTHPDFPWAKCTPDFHDYPGKTWIFEIKNCDWSQEWSDETFPAYYRVQVLWQMFVTGLRNAKLIALLSGKELKEYTVPWDQDCVDKLVSAASAFWNDHVRNDKIIPITGSYDCSKYLLARYPVPAREDLLVSNDTIDSMADEYQSIKTVYQMAEEKKQRLENELKAIIGDSKGIQGPGYRLTWSKSGQHRRFCSKFDRAEGGKNAVS